MQVCYTFLNLKNLYVNFSHTTVTGNFQVTDLLCYLHLCLQMYHF